MKKFDRRIHKQRGIEQIEALSQSAMAASNPVWLPKLIAVGMAA